MSKLPTGVEIRGRYIRIWFMFRGKRCRETLKGWEITNSNIKKAGNLRSLIWICPYISRHLLSLNP
ncbi:Arm DNA-binding domain-containing protein, partial [Escherichia coli]|uniref:Arm DNA-binding domain-containing protein n=1 Tax=Escherichia coli TaxID=562 RepID=UPI0030C74F3E